MKFGTFSLVPASAGLSYSLVPVNPAAHFAGAGKGKSVLPVHASLPVQLLEQGHAVGLYHNSGPSQQPKKTKRGVSLDWEAKFAVLRAFKKVHGHCRVPPGLMLGGFRLGGWVETQRKEYKKHRLGLASSVINDKRIARLERNGFEWDLDGEELWSPTKLFGLGTTAGVLAMES